MAKKLKKYEVLVKALGNSPLINLDINVLNKRGNNVFKKVKESMASGWPNPYLSFIEENGESFTLKNNYNYKSWNGTLEYSTDIQNWSEWNGAEISSSSDGKLYLRGTGNSKITGDCGYKFVLTNNKSIQCLGNIENLLDYKTVKAGKHPVMDNSCYVGMFYDCKSLTTAPELPATSLSNKCYNYMFQNCTNLTTAPELPATKLAECCYDFMFAGCKSLTTAPQLPAKSLSSYCYHSMFNGCTSLTTAPELPAKTLTPSCYQGMFYGCKSLTTAPQLPATKLSSDCYNGMFRGCINLTTPPPQLPATTLVYNCYTCMFYNCTNLTGTIHCPASTANDSKRLDANTDNIPADTATVVYDL